MRECSLVLLNISLSLYKEAVTERILLMAIANYSVGGEVRINYNADSSIIATVRIKHEVTTTLIYSIRDHVAESVLLARTTGQQGSCGWRDHQ